MERVYAALFLTLLGVGAIALSLTYGLGNTLEPGAGYFPFLVSVLLTVLSSVMTLKEYRSRRQSEALGSWPVRQLVLIIAALVVFAVLMGALRNLHVPGAGLLPATFFLVLISSRADRQLRFLDSALLALLLTVVSWIAFIELLGLAVPLWPWSY